MFRLCLFFFIAMAFWGCADIPDDLRNDAKAGDGCSGKAHTEYQFCANGVVYDFCGGTPYNPELVACCNNHQYTKSTEFCSGLSIYRRCEGLEYDPETQFCSDEKVYSKCGNSSYSPATQFCWDSKVYSLCGGSEYDPDKQSCSGSTISSKCGTSPYNPSTQFCSNSTVYSKCGGSEYDPDTQVCSGSTISSKCGTSSYNPSTQFCSNSTVYSKCGGLEYDPYTQVCSGSTISSKCGTSSYNPSTQFCSNSTIYSKCGGNSYNPATEECQSEIVKGKCGTNWYSVATQFCSGGNIYFLCVGTEYDPLTKYCSNNTLKSYVFVTDGRDNQIYKAVEIGTQTWMAENLNYNVGSSRCIYDDPTHCQEYGRLYDWATAMAFDATCNSISCASQVGTKHRGICPNDWHIPSDMDWNVLMKFINPSCSDNSSCAGAGTKLKATNLWLNEKNNTDEFGFSALPGGSIDTDPVPIPPGVTTGPSPAFLGLGGHWWSSSEYDSYNANARNMNATNINREDTYWSNDDKRDLFSVRCIKD